MEYVDNACYFCPFNSEILKITFTLGQSRVHSTERPFPNGICKCKCKDIPGKDMVNIYDLPRHSPQTSFYVLLTGIPEPDFVCLFSNLQSFFPPLEPM